MHLHARLAAASSLAAVLLAGCSALGSDAGTIDTPVAVETTPSTQATVDGSAHDGAAAAGAATDHQSAGTGHAVHWAYDGEAGPAAWGGLSEDWALCATGVEQSPIDVERPAAGDPAGTAAASVDAKVSFAYRPSAFEVVDNGHTIQVNLADAGSLIIEGTPYQLVQFHAHAPSEHTVDEVQFPLEYHLVHKSATGALAVVGVFVQEGAAHGEWAKVFAQLPAEGGTAAGTGLIDPALLLPPDHTMVRYAGSLTTPPCTESVRWHVLLDPVQLSHEQLATFTARYPDSHRPVQPRNVRQLEVLAG